jgi:hypothetical protein
VLGIVFKEWVRKGAHRNGMIMMHKIFAASCMAGIIITGVAAAPAYAGGGNPSGTGQPNVECGEGIGSGPHGFSTGGFANAETRYAGSDGTPSAENSNSDKAVSQYDVACAHAAPAAQVDATAPTMPDSTTLTAPGPDTPKRVHPAHGHN